jgi:hypothetical protein
MINHFVVDWRFAYVGWRAIKNRRDPRMMAILANY